MFLVHEGIAYYCNIGQTFFIFSGCDNDTWLLRLDQFKTTVLDCLIERSGSASVSLSLMSLCFLVQVTEAKGLSQLLVGMVTCASADFFVARPQLMLVDVTELGTIKLQLEVTWKYVPTKPPQVPTKQTQVPTKQPLGPRKGRTGPHKAKTGPHKATSGPHKATSGPHRATTGPHRATTGPHSSNCTLCTHTVCFVCFYINMSAIE